nr:MAG TPA: hypothetical protein [Caudoviricetes sp.]
MNTKSLNLSNVFSSSDTFNSFLHSNCDAKKSPLFFFFDIS